MGLEGNQRAPRRRLGSALRTLLPAERERLLRGGPMVHATRCEPTLHVAAGAEGIGIRDRDVRPADDLARGDAALKRDRVREADR